MKVLIDYETLSRYAYSNCWCDKDAGEYIVSECTRDGEFEIDIKDIELDRTDLEELVEIYKDEILEILGKEERKKEKKQVLQQSKTLDNWMG
ncbi:hypothetical protein AAGT10_14850 (plasmid) [Sulfolobus tengchongensis]|uniref:Uncharacterized protein n=1 Tax=Sulfolobus tengchongensis TaxID=207809 RepID=A0AAX4L1N3_9CREN